MRAHTHTNTYIYVCVYIYIYIYKTLFIKKNSNRKLTSARDKLKSDNIQARNDFFHLLPFVTGQNFLYHIFCRGAWFLHRYFYSRWFILHVSALSKIRLSLPLCLIAYHTSRFIWCQNRLCRGVVVVLFKLLLGVKGAHFFVKGITLNVNIIARLEFDGLVWFGFMVYQPLKAI